MNLRTLIGAGVLGAGLCLPALAQQNRTFTSQYSFGDSLSDTGNVFALSRGTQPPAPYYNGRFSNGVVFTELLGNAIVPAGTVSVQRGNLNFAFGGATAGPGGTVPSLSQQVGLYRSQGLPAAKTDLFTVLAGANDLIPVLGSPTTAFNPSVLDSAGATAAQAVASNVQSLVGFGARNVVVAGLPALGLTPRSLAVGGVGGAGYTFGNRASTAFNNELRSRLAPLAAATSDLNLVYVDLDAIFQRVVQDYRALGFSNVSNYFLAPAAQGGGVGDSNSYVFWDDIHPTTKVHAIMAAIVVEQLNPERGLGFEAATGSAALALQTLASRAVESRIEAAAATKRKVGQAEAYASYTYGDGIRAADGWRPRFSHQAQVVTGGADLRWSTGFVAGAAVTAGRMAVDVTGGRGVFTVEDTGARAYGIWQGGPVSLAADAGYGALGVNGIRRTTAFGGFRTNAKTAGSRWGAGLKALWSIEGGSTVWRPFLGLRTERVKLDPFVEREVPALSLSLEGQEARSSAGQAGIDGTFTSQLAGRAFRFDVRAAWQGEIGSRQRAVTGRLADNFTRPTAVMLKDGDGSGVELGGAATLQLGRSWSASLGYHGDIRSGERLSSRVNLSLQSGF